MKQKTIQNSLIRRIGLPIFLLGWLLGIQVLESQAQSVPVTLQVDMNLRIFLGQFNPSTDYVDVAGSFNGWGGTALSDSDNDGIYSGMIGTLPTGTPVEFKFRINGNWTTSEFPGGGPNRSYTPVEGTNNPLYHYNFLNPVVTATFMVVDGTQSYSDIEFKGNMTDWTKVQMYDDGTHGDATAGDHTWTVQLPVGLGTWEWGAIENDGSEWGIWLISGPNQSITVSDAGTVSGQLSYAIPPPGNIPFTLSVNMNFQMAIGAFDPASDFVDVAGSLNNWNGTQLSDPDGDGIYTVTIPNLTLGMTYYFKFRINGDWNLAEFPGGANRSYTIVTGINQASYWYSDLELGPPANVTFTVSDGTGLYTDIEIKGQFNSWTLVQTYDDGTHGDVFAGDHVWTVVLSVVPGTWQWGAIENDGSQNGIWLIQGPNPEFTLSPLGTISGQVNYVIPAPQLADVTFNVNLSYQITLGNFNPTTDFVDVAGSFSGYSGVAMSDPDGDGIFSVSIADLQVGSVLMFKFRKNGDWSFAELFGFPDREYTVVDGVNNPTYWFNNQEPTITYVDLTFNVNMNEQIALGAFNPATGFIELMGSFTNWTGTSMTDGDGDGIYTCQILDLMEGNSYDFKFRLNGNWATSEFGGGANRTITVNSGTTSYSYYYDDELQIHTIQFTSDPTGASPFTGQALATRGVVTAAGPGGFFIQQGQGAWNGLFVSGSSYSPSPGDMVFLRGTIAENGGQTHMDNLTVYSVMATGAALPASQLMATGSLFQNEPLESVLVEISSASCTNTNAGNGEWTLNDGSGPINADDYFVAYSPTQGSNYHVKGILLTDGLTLAPRDLSDIEMIVFTHTLALNFGWNLISTYIAPTNPAIANVFQSIVGQLRIIKNGNGQIYWPQFNVNTIGNMVTGQGYQVNVLSAQALAITGQIVNPATTPLSLAAGWNMIGYLRTSTGPIATMLTTITGQFNIIKNGQGQVYWPLFGINTIVQMHPGAGYQISMKFAATLTYPANSTMTEKALPLPETSYFQSSQPTDQNLTMAFPLEVLPAGLSQGFELALVGENGLVAASTTWYPGNLALSAWGDDKLSAKRDGLTAGESFHLVVWDPLLNAETHYTILNDQGRQPVYAADQLQVATRLLPREANGSTPVISPNPASGSATLFLTSATDDLVQIDLIASNGQTIAVLPNNPVAAGQNRIDLPVSQLATGIYSVRLTSQDGKSQQTRLVIQH